MKTKVISLPKRKQAAKEIIDEEIKARLSVARCRDILQEEGQSLSDEEILKIRDYLYRLAAIGWEQYQYQQQQQAKIIQLEEHKTADHEKSYYLRAG